MTHNRQLRYTPYDAGGKTPFHRPVAPPFNSGLWAILHSAFDPFRGWVIGRSLYASLHSNEHHGNPPFTKFFFDKHLAPETGRHGVGKGNRALIWCISILCVRLCLCPCLHLCVCVRVCVCVCVWWYHFYHAFPVGPV